MREIQYQAKPLGRSGHALKDLFTSVILAKLLNARVVRSPYWHKQALISAENFEAFLPQPSANFAQVVFRGSKFYWGGISWAEFKKFRDYFHGLPEDCRVRISGVYRIHLCQVKNWEDDGLVPNGSFDSLVKELRQLYWGTEKQIGSNAQVRKIVFHARRGDVSNPKWNGYHVMGPGRWSAGFYQEKINLLRETYPEASVRLITEAKGSADLDKIANAELVKGNRKTLESNFREMVTADLFLPTGSSLSSWAAYLNPGLIAVSLNHEIKHYRFNNWPANHIQI